MPRPSAPSRAPASRRRTGDEPVWLYGRHAVLAALQNPNRHQRKLLATKNALDWLAERGRMIDLAPVKPDAIDHVLHPGAVHQGLAMQANSLAAVGIEDVLATAPQRPVVILDQVTDPQNIGAIFRIAAAFGAGAVIAQDRRTPPLAGALAKAAVGAIETIPMVRVVNISRAMNQCEQSGYHVVGLAGDGGADLPSFSSDRPIALVMGAEGSGLREKVQSTCETLVRIPMEDTVESLNVATAVGTALYAMTKGR